MQQPPNQTTILAELREIRERMRQDPEAPKNLTDQEFEQWLLNQIQRRRMELGIPLSGSSEASKQKRA